jgi:hypothetical protein
MLRFRRLLGLAGGGVIILLAAPATSALAIGTTPPPSPTTSGNTIVITVTGTGVRGGSAGHTAQHTRTVAAPCSMDPMETGKEYYDWVKSGNAARLWHNTGSDRESGAFAARPGYEQYKDDTKGLWYGGSCSSETYGSNLDAFFAYSDKWLATHQAVYVPVGTQPPAPPVPPELLRDIAAEELTLPGPTINWNPKRVGDAATLVNIDTWVWLTDRRTNLYVDATANSDVGQVTARVDANLQGMTVSAPGVPEQSCPDGGVPYAQGATGECAIKFTNGSPNGGKTPVTTRTQWFATWSFNGEDRGAIPVQPAGPAQVTTIGVREVQAVVNR